MLSAVNRSDKILTLDSPVEGMHLEIAPLYPQRLGYRIPGRVCCLLMVLLWIATPAGGQDPTSDRIFEDEPRLPWQIAADTITYDQNADRYTASGNVTITKQQRQLSADEVTFDNRTTSVTATGRVLLTAGENVLTADRIEMDLVSETGALYNGTVFLKKNHFYLQGDKIQKVGPNNYTADRVTLSTCDGPRPAWKITGRDLRMNLEGKSTVKHATLWARKMPVLYSPYLFFPARKERQSGLLIPSAGNSDRKGLTYTQPYFWAIDDNVDATFYWNHMQKRGERMGIEFRYILAPGNRATLMADGFNDRQIDDGSAANTSQWGYVEEDRDILRTNTERYWIRMKLDQQMPWDLKARLDLDLVSDQDYLIDFRDGINGFNQNQNYFTGIFGRQMDDYSDPVRTNRLNLNRIWSQYSLNMEARWYDDSHPEGGADRVHQLPWVTFSSIRQPLAGGPFDFAFDTDYSNFYSRDGDRGQRVDLFPVVAWPYRQGRLFTLEPSLGFRQTLWLSDDGNGTLPGSDDDIQHRELIDTAVNLTSEIYRVYGLGRTSGRRLKHRIRPRVRYRYIPAFNQSDYPLFDSRDRIPGRNRLTYALTNLLTLKTPPDRPDRSARLPGGLDYNQFLRFHLEQSYDFDTDSSQAWANPSTTGESRPFSPLSASLELVPEQYLSLDADAKWCPYDDSFTNINTSARLWNRRGDIVGIESRYDRDRVHSLYADARVILTQQLTAYTAYERDLNNRRDLKRALGFEYVRQCWGVNFGYIDEDEDQRFEFMVHLFGLGSTSQSEIGRWQDDPFGAEQAWE